MIAASKVLRERKEKSEEEARIRAEAEKRLQEENRRKAQELERRAALEQAAANHQRALQLRAFISAAQVRGGVDPVALQKWMAWAEDHAWRIDPMENGTLLKLINEMAHLRSAEVFS